VAPFDFPIYKSAEELAQEKKVVEQTYTPYFKADSAVIQKNVKQLSDDFDKLNLGLNANLKKTLADELGLIYKRGVWKKEELPANFQERSMLIVSIINDNESEDQPASQLYTNESAHTYLRRKVQDCCGIDQLILLTSAIDLRKYIEPNLSYDAKTTQQVKDNELANIPITKGGVKEGDKIIDEGEVVGATEYQLLDSLRKEYKGKTGYTGNFWLLFLGQILLVSMCLATLCILLKLLRSDVLLRVMSVVFILMLIVLFSFLFFFVQKAGISAQKPWFNVFIVPITIIPIYISTFFSVRPAIITYWVVLMLFGFYAPDSFEFIFLSFVAGVASVISFRTMYRRGRLFVSMGMVLAAYVVSYLAIHSVQDGSFGDISWIYLLNFGLNTFFLLTAYQLVYLFEKMFGFLSNVTLMELSDTNRKLLRTLAENAPGTFQHSMQVANLAEDVIREIGGNPLLVRCGALYHDIGKLENPAYFIENQASGFNPHELLEPEQSAAILIGHVEYGVQLAKKYNLPNAIVDFIRTHHGTSRTFYFYSKYKEKHPDATDFSMFEYPGPSPMSKETAVVMMADSVEAASRTLSPINVETIDNLVEKIINGQRQNGYFDNVSMTFKDITEAKRILKKKLGNIYHARIEYPEEKS
jgi:putative nucleotidyltransferase with HDIG domain